ncbi:pleckstrin homology domain-containing family F member 1 [Cololabis saira]|uniref:pleckstrin homology domain-containing family F member 1 n=1 Tax=Cololabis saira TaxID=129043 RepID=UPI002AD26AF1|nr:pleckstrin homology domain-containing family F member 1 [Cololabis saira]
MVDELSVDQKNLQRIHAVELSFGASGRPLCAPGRVLVGEGRLTKQSRRRTQDKAFFLFNDLLVYGSIVLHGRWYTRQQVIPLEDVQLEDLDDGLTLKNQWLIRTPRKSFSVAAASREEKRAWMEHIADSRSRRLQSSESRAGSSESRAGSSLAVAWVPDGASSVCMRCSGRFSVTQRRHHCRQCGLVVCGGCSQHRRVIPHIHPTKRLRVCRACHSGALARDGGPWRGHGTGRGGSEEEELSGEETVEEHDPGTWGDRCSPFSYLTPPHRRC